MTTSKEKYESKKLPMMPIRDVVIFPFMMTPFVVGRESSVRALEEALAADKKIFLATQHDASIDEPKSNEIYQVGTIVNIVSDAGKLASPKAGPAYVMSKFGLAGLTQAINAEERTQGIRACAIFPGDIDTPLLDKRPAPPGAEARAKMLQPEDVAACVLLAIQLPARAVVEEILVRPG